MKKTPPPKPSVRATPEGTAVRVFIADDHSLLRELTVALFRKDPKRFKIVGEAATAEDAIRGCAEIKPNVLILDLRFPGVSGAEAVPKLRDLSPQTRILLCSGSASDQEVVTALRLGVDGFMSKAGRPTELLTAVEQLAKGDRYFCQRTAAILANFTRAGPSNSEARAAGGITEREKEVMRLIAAGQTSKEIATALGISLATVDTHRRNVMVKAGVRNIAGLIRFGQANGLLPRPERT